MVTGYGSVCSQFYEKFNLMKILLLRFAGRKLLRLILLMFTVSLLSFILLSLSPIDPVRAYIGADMLRVSPEQRNIIAERWGLNDPPATRYFLWLGQALSGNLGTSMIYNDAVIHVIGTRFVASVSLIAFAWIISGLLGFALGVAAGSHENSWADRVVRFYAYTLASTPAFWLGLLLLIIFAVTLKLTPVGGIAPPGLTPDDLPLWERLQYLILPALTLSITGVANIALHTRQKLIDVLNSDYALFARAQGETNAGLIRQHGLRNIALPAITLQFASFSELFGGTILVEQVFAYPGLGQATVEAGVRGDAPLLLGIVLFSAVFVFAGNTLADLVYNLVDPRIRISRGAKTV
jgi:peptide/nickel transport system permease protein